MSKRTVLITVVALAMLLVLAACQPVTPQPTGGTAPEAGMPNPASVYCEENGGTLEIRDGEGGQAGICVFADGSECDEWAYFRGDCQPGDAEPQATMTNPASSYCVEQGGTSEIRQGDGGEVGYCVFADGSECEEWAFYRGACAPGGTTPQANMANPASLFCSEQGGTSEIRQGDGGEVGYCVFADGSECEEWALFRGECQAGN